MTAFDKLLQDALQIEQKLGYTFSEKSLLALSFVHRSFVNENRNAVRCHNERLEFLGDAVLGVLISEYLYRSLPDHSEGELSRLRSRLVECQACSAYVKKMDLSSFLLLGKGERMNEGRGRETILSDLFEALIGAVYLDGGIESARRFLFENFEESFRAIIDEPARNWKAELQDFAQKRYQQAPVYKVVSEMGPDHSKVFNVCVWVNSIEVGQGTGSSKKEAQQAAAEAALQKLESEHCGP